MYASSTQANLPLHKEFILFRKNEFELLLANNEKLKKDAFSIRYKAYLNAKIIEPSKDKLLTDRYDSTKTSYTFLVKYEGKPVATARSCVYAEEYHWQKTEAISYFEKELYDKLGPKTPLLESNRFAVDPAFQGRNSLMARLLLFRAHGLNAGAHGCKYIITSVQSNHVPFYRRYLNLVPISNNEKQIHWCDARVSLLMNTTDNCFGTVLKKGMPEYTNRDIELFKNILATIKK